MKMDRPDNLIEVWHGSKIMHLKPKPDFSGDSNPGETASVLTFGICGLIALGVLIKLMCCNSPTLEKTQDCLKSNPPNGKIEMLIPQNEKRGSQENGITNVHYLKFRRAR